MTIAGAQWRLRSGANVEIEGEDNLHQLCSQDIFIGLVVNMIFITYVLKIRDGSGGGVIFNPKKIQMFSEKIAT